MTKTILTAHDHNGKVVFHSVEPRRMSEAEIRKECIKWVVPRKKTIVQYV